MNFTKLITPEEPGTKKDLILKVKIISPKKIFFDGVAHSVSSTNSAGNFDILPEHANFITLVQNSPIIIRTDQKQETAFKFPLAIIYSTKNNVKIYTDLQISLHPES